MNLVIDIGNTLCKVSVVEQTGKILENFKVDNLIINFLDNIFKKFPSIDKAVLSSVRERDDELCNYLKHRVDYFVEVTHTTPVPILNLYSTPQTLGIDRLMGAVGASSIFQNKDILIFDLGSAITIDYVSREGKFMGGNISPGLYTRIKALNAFTKKLPLVDVADKKISFYGKSTEEAILNGVVKGIIYEIEGYIEELKEKNDDFVIIFTGGDAKYFENKVKYTIFVNSYLLIDGLNKVLEYNYENKK